LSNLEAPFFSQSHKIFKIIQRHSVHLTYGTSDVTPRNWYLTFQASQCAAIRKNVKSSVTHSHFSLGESIRCQTWR